MHFRYNSKQKEVSVFVFRVFVTEGLYFFLKFSLSLASTTPFSPLTDCSRLTLCWPLINESMIRKKKETMDNITNRFIEMCRWRF